MAQVSDLFTRADENPLSGGGVWATCTGQTAIKLTSNTARPSAVSAGCEMRHSGVNAGSTQFCKVKFGTLGGGSTIIPALCLCYDTGGAVTGYRLQYNSSTGQWTVYKMTSGSSAGLDLFSYTLVSGDTMLFTLEGGNLKAYANGTLKITVADSTYSSGNPGMHLYSNSSVDDLQVTEFYGGDGTDWTGGAGAVPLLMQHYN